MSQKTITIETIKEIINTDYDRANRLYKRYSEKGHARMRNYYLTQMEIMIDFAAQIEQKTGATIFDDEGEQCEATFKISSPDPTSQNTPAKSITTAFASSSNFTATSNPAT